MKNSLVSKVTVLGLMMVGAGVAFVTGCRTDKGGNPDEEDSQDSYITAGMVDDVVRRYGVWVGKGPQVISDTGEPLVNAKVKWPGYRNIPASLLFVDRKARIIIDNYITNTKTFEVSCPGFHSRWVGITPEGKVAKYDRMLSDRSDCIVMRREHRPHPMSKHTIEMRLPMDATNDVIRIDLVDGELLAPYGYGRHADAEFVFGAPQGAGSVPVQLKLLGANDGASELQKFKDALGVPYEVDDAACTNRLVAGDGPLGLRVRGYYGNAMSAPKASISGGWRQGSTEGGTLWLNFSWRMNREPGDLGLECAGDDIYKHHPPPPQKRDVKAEEGKLAFGVSSDGRSAVCFGKVSSEVRVPDIFPHVVYTSDPAKDLPQLDTLYFERPMHYIPPRMFANHPTLRVAAIVDMSTETVQEEAFAGCTNLNMFVGIGWTDSITLAESAFDGCAKDFTLMFLGPDRRDTASAPWDSSACTNVVSRRVVVPCDRDEMLSMFAPAVDFDSGKVEIPLLHFDGGRFWRESSDGKVLVLDSVGRKTKRRISE